MSRDGTLDGGVGGRCAGVTSNNVVFADCASYCDSDCDVDSLICLAPSLMKSF